MLMATIPGVYRYNELVQEILNNRLITDIRLNTGTPSPHSAYDTLAKLKSATEKTIWVDLKCRQLRVDNWCDPYYSEVVLNHEVEVELPAQIQFRGSNIWYEISEVNGNKIYLEEVPNEAVGKGQSVNIRTNSLLVKGYFTEKDTEYMEAAQSLGINHFLLSFYEGSDDLELLRMQFKPSYLIHAGLKIESEKGIAAVEELKQDMTALNAFPHEKNITLVVARDDLMANLRNKVDILDVLERCIAVDQYAYAASQIFSGLEHNGVCAGDISDLHLLHLLGYKNFLLSDGICLRHFEEAISLWQNYQYYCQQSKKGG